MSQWVDNRWVGGGPVGGLVVGGWWVGRTHVRWSVVGCRLLVGLWSTCQWVSSWYSRGSVEHLLVGWWLVVGESVEDLLVGQWLVDRGLSVVVSFVIRQI